MIKNATIYRFEKADNGIAALWSAFVPCGPTQEKSVGWVPPRGHEHGELVEYVGGEMIVKLMIETKSVPARTLREAVDKKAAEIEDATGRKPGRKERRNLQGELLLELLPHAFPKQTAVLCWIDRTNGLLVIDTTSQSKADEFVSALIKVVDGLTVSLLQTATTPQAAMTEWLLAADPEGWPADLCIERECTLKATGDGATVKFAQHSLTNDDVRKHVTEGKLPTQLAMSWDGRVSFVLTEHLQLKKVQLLDGVMDAAGTDKGEDRFDADVVLTTGLLRPMLASLIDAMGGLLTWDAKK